MDRSKWFARLALAAATVGILAAAEANAGYDYPMGDHHFLGLLPENTVYYGYSYDEDRLDLHYVTGFDSEDRAVCEFMMHDKQYGTKDIADDVIELYYIGYYDDSGNMVAKERLDPVTGEVLAHSEWTYDEKGRMIAAKTDNSVSTTTYSADGLSSVTVGETILEDGTSVLKNYCEYDAHGEMIYTRAENTGYESWWKNEYDAQGRLIRSDLSSEAGGEADAGTSYTYEGDLLSEEYIWMKMGDKVIMANRKRYTYNEYGHQVLQEKTDKDGDVERTVTEYYLCPEA